MSNFRMSFSGDVRKPRTMDIGGKKAVEFQLMKKNYGKPDAPAAFTWVRVTLFDAKDWQIAQCEEGKFVAGSGEFTLRSYEKDGEKRQSAEIRCSSFDLDGPYAAKPEAAAAPVASPRPSVSTVGGGNDGPPF